MSRIKKMTFLPQRNLLQCIVFLFFTSCSYQLMAIEDDWVFKSQQRSAWVDEQGDCGEWSISRESIDYGKKFINTRYCEIKQKQTITKIFLDDNNQTHVKKDYDYRFVTKNIRKEDVGTRDKIIKKAYEPWGDYVFNKFITTCQSVIDLSDQVDLNQLTAKYRTCLIKETQHKFYVNYWLSGKKTIDDQKSDERSRIIERPFFNLTVGKKDRWQQKQDEILISDVVNLTDCLKKQQKRQQRISEQITYGNWIEMPVLCQRNIQKKKITYALSLSGKKKDYQEEKITRHKNQWVFLSTIGQRDQLIESSEKEAEQWHLKPDSSSCQMLNKHMENYVDINQPFVSMIYCQAKEQLARVRIEKYLSGKVNQIPLSYKERNKETWYSSTLVGNSDQFIERTDQYRHGAWINTSRKDCALPQPNKYSMPRDQIYLSTVSCQQNQHRTTERLERWTSGDKWLKTQDERRVIHDVQSFFEQGERLVETAEKATEVMVKADQTLMSDVYHLADDIAYQRLKLTIKSNVPLSSFEIDLRGSNGKITSLPLIDRERMVIFMDLKDYHWQSNGDWVLIVHNKRKEVVTLTYSYVFQQR